MIVFLARLLEVDVNLPDLSDTTFDTLAQHIPHQVQTTFGTLAESLRDQVHVHSIMSITVKLKMRSLSPHRQIRSLNFTVVILLVVSCPT